jgi:hypothetical protein
MTPEERVAGMEQLGYPWNGDDVRWLLEDWRRLRGALQQVADKSPFPGGTRYIVNRALKDSDESAGR